MARLSGLFSGPGDSFRKAMTKTDLQYITAVDLRPAGDPSPAIDDFENYTGDVWFGFCDNLFEKLSP